MTGIVIYFSLINGHEDIYHRQGRPFPHHRSPENHIFTFESRGTFIFSKYSHSLCQVLAVTAAKVYVSQAATRWSPVGTGALAFVLESPNTIRQYHFALVDYGDRISKVIWHFKVYIDPNYIVEKNYFHTIEGPNCCVYGFLFANEFESSRFAKIVSEETHTGHDKVKVEKKKMGFFATLFGRNKKKLPSEKLNRLNPEDIGDPLDFQHLSHIGFNPETESFDVKNIPTEWRSVFAKAGVTREQLENRDTAAFIADFIRKKSDSKDINEVSDIKNKNAHVSAQKNTRQKGPPVPPKKINLNAVKLPPPPPPKKKIGITVNNNAAPVKNESFINSSTKVDETATEILSRSNKNSEIECKNDNHQDIAHTVTSSNATSHTPLNQTKPQHPARINLMASIRESNIKQLKPATDRQNDDGDNVGKGKQSEEPSDLMADMLAKALAARNKKLALSDSESE